MFARLFKPKWQNPLADVRVSAVAQLSIADPQQRDILTRLASSDPNPAVRQAAVAKVVDLETLMNASSGDPDDAVKSAATDRLRDVLGNNIDVGPDLDARIAALKSRNDQDTCHYVVNHGADQIRNAALDLLTDEYLLEDIAVNCQRAKLRTAAAERLHTLDALESVAQQTIKKDKSVYKIARRKLSDHRCRQRAVEGREQRLNALCEAMEHLAQAEHIASYAAKRNILWTEWVELNPDPGTALAQRCIAANQVCLVKAQRLQSAQAVKLKADTERRRADQVERTAIDELLDCARHVSLAPVETTDGLAALQETLKTRHAVWHENMPLSAVDADGQAQFDQCYRKLRRYQRSAQSFIASKDEINKINTKVKGLRIPDDMAHIKPLKGKLSQILDHIGWDNGFKAPAELAAAQRSWERLIELEQARLKWQQEQVPGFIAKLALLRSAVEKGDSRAANRLVKGANNLCKRLPEKAVAPHRGQLKVLSAEIRKLQDWKSFATTPKKETLCRQMEALVAEDMNPRDKADRIQQLQHEWKRLGGGEGAGSQDLWQRFSTASDQAFAPCREYFEQQNRQRAQHLAERKRICERLSQCIQETTWDDPDWAQVDQTVHAARQEWRQLHVYRNEGRDTQRRFEELLGDLKCRLDEEWQRNAQKKRDVIENIVALGGREDSHEAIQQTKQLQQKWKSIGKTPGKTDRRLWKEFRAACDAVFARRDQLRQDQEAMRNVHAEQAADVIGQINQLSDHSDGILQGTQGKYRQLIEDFQNLGTLPKARVDALRGKFEEACAHYELKFSGIGERLERAQLGELKRRAQICQTLEQRILDTASTIESNELADIEQAWTSGGLLPEASRQVMEQRFAAAVAAARENKPEALQQNFSANLEARQMACVQLEILADVETPEPYKKARMDYQLLRLSKSLGQRQHDDRTRLQQARDLEQLWYGIGAVDKDNTEALNLRFFKALSALAGPGYG